MSLTEFDDEEDQEIDVRCIDISKDAVCLGLLKEGVLPDTVDLEESKEGQKEGEQLLLEGAEALLQGVTCAQAGGKDIPGESNA